MKASGESKTDLVFICQKLIGFYAKVNNIAVVHDMMKLYGANPFRVMENGMNCFHHMAKEGKMCHELFETLLRARYRIKGGEDVDISKWINFRTSKSLNTPLHYAAMNDDEVIY